MTVDVPTALPSRLVIGVLALQGAFIEHILYLERLKLKDHTITAVAVRHPEELERCHALILPGGESTAITRLASLTPALLPALLAYTADPTKPVWGTCAGMILLADPNGVGGGKAAVKANAYAPAWGGFGGGLKVWRNLYGGQLESFQHEMRIPVLSESERPFNAIFIRAPAVHSYDRGEGAGVEALAALPAECVPAPPPGDSGLGEPDASATGVVMLRRGRKLVTSFHPELSGDVRVHEFWVRRCVLGEGESV